MNKSDLNRRDFNKLTAAAFGGVLAGTALGCANEGGEAKAATPEKNVCRGLNACKDKGAGGDNACAGQGKCATAEHHSCHKENACAGQGGCGDKPGQNDCKAKGECAVPLGEKAWEKARAAFEEKMKAAGKTVGAAPAKG